jgi:hypothetical protein
MFVVVAVFFAVFALIPARSSAGSLSTGVIGMFPKETGEFAYADLKSARKYSWFPALRDQLLPGRFRQFEQFLASAGVDPNAQVDELAWAGMPVTNAGSEEVMGIAIGTFNPSSSEDRFKQQKLAVIQFEGYHLYAFGSGTGSSDILFVFLDTNTAAFGNRPALEKLIDVRMGGSESLLANDRIFPLINEENGSGMVWAVLDHSYTHVAMQQLIPQANQFPQAAAIINRLHAMTINFDADSGLSARFQAVCDSVDDANLLSAALQAGLMYRRYQEAQSNPDFAKLLDSVQVLPSGDRLKVNASMSEEQISSLIRTRVFAVPM